MAIIMSHYFYLVIAIIVSGVGVFSSIGGIVAMVHFHRVFLNLFVWLAFVLPSTATFTIGSVIFTIASFISTFPTGAAATTTTACVFGSTIAVRIELNFFV